MPSAPATWPPCSARLSRPPSISATRAGKPWARAGAIRCSTAPSSPCFVNGGVTLVLRVVPLEATLGILLWIGRRGRTRRRAARRCARLRRPSPGSQPPITSSWRADVLDLHPAAERARRARSGESRRLATMPSSRCSAVASQHVAPWPTRCSGVCQRSPLSAERVEQLAPLVVGQLHQRVAVEPQQVEDHVRHRRGLGEPFGLRARADVHAPLQRGEARAPVLVEGDDLAVEDRRVRAERAVQPARAPDSCR